MDGLLSQLLYDFNTYGESTIILDNANVLSLKLPSPYPITNLRLGKPLISKEENLNKDKDLKSGKHLNIDSIHKDQRSFPEVDIQRHLIYIYIER